MFQTDNAISSGYFLSGTQQLEQKKGKALTEQAKYVLTYKMQTRATE